MNDAKVRIFVSSPADVARAYRHKPMAAHLDETARKGRGATEF